MTKSLAPDRSNDERALQAAARLFREHGYPGTSLRDIARAADMPPGSLHYRFPSKEDILAALMERAIDRLIDGIVSAIAGTPDPIERIRVAIITHVQILLSREDLVYVLLYVWRSLSTPAERKF